MADPTGPDSPPPEPAAPPPADPAGTDPTDRGVPAPTKAPPRGQRSPRYWLRRVVVFGGIAVLALVVAIAIVPNLVEDDATSSGLQPAKGLPVTEPGPTAKPAAGPHWSVAITCNGACRLAADSSRAYVVEGSKPESTRTSVSGYDSASGKRSWSSRLSLHEVSTLRVTDIGLVASGDDTTVVIDPDDGTQQWTSKGELVDVTAGGVILTDPEGVATPVSRLVERGSGKLKWKAAGALTACGSHYLAGTDKDLVARTSSGHEVWSERLPVNVARTVSCNDDILAIRRTDTEISVRSIDNGDEIDTIKNKDADLAVFVADDDTVITVGGGKVRAYARAGDTYEPKWSAKGPDAFVVTGQENAYMGEGRLLIVIPTVEATMLGLSDGKALGRRSLRVATLQEVTTASLIAGNLDGVDAFDLSDLSKRWTLDVRFIEAIAAGGPHLYAIVNDNTLQAYA